MATAFEPNSTLGTSGSIWKWVEGCLRSLEDEGGVKGHNPAWQHNLSPTRINKNSEVVFEVKHRSIWPKLSSSRVAHLAGTVDRSGYGAVDLLVCAKDKFKKDPKERSTPSYRQT
ncbi:hypothetical protein B0H14DRAFT_2594747 [Mycena olivaceomarginata]|nr:hypothetical protein B0H14DRAFT_2594747 [Mycena olivaceomarginata]